MNKQRLIATEEALDLIKLVKAEYEGKGIELIFHQAGGCCEGTKPSLYKKHRFRLRRGDVKIGQLEGIDFWVDKDLFKYWEHTQFQIYVVDGFGAGGLSLETSKGKTFLTKHIIVSEKEKEWFNQHIEVR